MKNSELLFFPPFHSTLWRRIILTTMYIISRQSQWISFSKFASEYLNSIYKEQDSSASATRIAEPLFLNEKKKLAVPFGGQLSNSSQSSRRRFIISSKGRGENTIARFNRRFRYRYPNAEIEDNLRQHRPTCTSDLLPTFEPYHLRSMKTAFLLFLTIPVFLYTNSSTGKIHRRRCNKFRRLDARSLLRFAADGNRESK